MRRFSIDRGRFEAMEARKKSLSAGYGKVMEEIVSVEASVARIHGHIEGVEPRNRAQSRELHKPAIARHQRELDRLERQKAGISRENQNALKVFERCAKLVAAAEAAEANAQYEANVALGEQPVGRHRLKPRTEPVQQSSFFADQVERQLSEHQASAKAFGAERDA